MPSCLTLSIIRYGSRVRWKNPGKGVALSPTPWCSSYRKGSLRVTLEDGQLVNDRSFGVFLEPYNFNTTRVLPSFWENFVELQFVIFDKMENDQIVHNSLRSVYIHIVIYRQTNSLYHNSSVWLDARCLKLGSKSDKRKTPGYLTTQQTQRKISRDLMSILTFSFGRESQNIHQVAADLIHLSLFEDLMIRFVSRD